MALRPGGKVKRRPGPIGKPQQPQKGIGRPKPSSKTKGPAGGPRPGSKPKPSVPRMPTVERKARGGMLKGIIKIPPLPAPQPMPRSGVISTIDKGIRKPRPAEKFVKIRERINKLGGYAMGGQAREGVAKAQVRQRNKRTPIGQKKLMEMLERLYGKQKIVPKKKPKKDK